MKSIKTLLVMLAIAIFFVPSLTSCLNDSTEDVKYHEVTPSEKMKIITDLSGNYTGNLLFFRESLKKDSLNTSCTIGNDSVINISYPVSLLSNYVPSTQAAAKEALKNAPNVSVALKIHIPNFIYEEYWNQYWLAGYYDIAITPVNKTIDFESQGHKFSLTLYEGTNSYAGLYYSPSIVFYKSQIQVVVNLKDFTYDGTMTILNLPTVFYGKGLYM